MMEEEDEQDDHAPPKQKKKKQGREAEEDATEPESEDVDMPDVADGAAQSKKSRRTSRSVSFVTTTESRSCCTVLTS